MQIMVDVETLDVLPTAAIIQIGYAVFEKRTIVESGRLNVSLASSMGLGLTVNAETIMWWLQQDDAARKSLTDGKRLTLDYALRFLRDPYIRYRIDFTWAWGPQFDIIVLENALRATSLEVPWDFRSVRDARTFFSFANVGRIMPSNRHDAEQDCIAQVQSLWAAADKLGIELE